MDDRALYIFGAIGLVILPIALSVCLLTKDVSKNNKKQVTQQVEIVQEFKGVTSTGNDEVTASKDESGEVVSTDNDAEVVSNVKSVKVDFSKADEIAICSVNNSNRQRIKNLVDEFGVVKLKNGDQIDFMAYESFLNVDSLVKSSLTSWWNGKYVESTDYKVTNQLGDGYFKLKCGAYKLYLLYVPA